ncbi:hypothetical protein ABT288_40075 [Streptomyces sp. NPDC001093]|uniref:hypothetical protein n=1 Tax=Streptomyces sp. NPDC001093 TaxID=3154376 RepID=UPI003318A4A9
MTGAYAALADGLAEDAHPVPGFAHALCLHRPITDIETAGRHDSGRAEFPMDGQLRVPATAASWTRRLPV